VFHIYLPNCRIPLDEWSTRRRDLHLNNTVFTTDRNPCPRWNSNRRNPGKRTAAYQRLSPCRHHHLYLWIYRVLFCFFPTTWSKWINDSPYAGIVLVSMKYEVTWFWTDSTVCVWCPYSYNWIKFMYVWNRQIKCNLISVLFSVFRIFTFISVYISLIDIYIYIYMKREF
jgi:hypothetical protein